MEEHYTLQTLLNALTKVKKNKVIKRLIFDQMFLGGIGSKWIMLFFISLPILLFLGIFNPTMFAMLGIAQAIIFYIVFLSMVMILIIATLFINNNKVIRQIEPSWESLFPDIDLRLIVSSGATPYKDFFKHYNKAVVLQLKDEKLFGYLQEAFEKMKIENKDLLEAMNSARTNVKKGN